LAFYTDEAPSTLGSRDGFFIWVTEVMIHWYRYRETLGTLETYHLNEMNTDMQGFNHSIVDKVKKFVLHKEALERHYDQREDCSSIPRFENLAGRLS
jgi:hypothetical protein